MEKISVIIYNGARIVAAIILLQTLYFKFSGAEESVYIFTTVGMEPWGRIGIGVVELMAAILLLFKKTAWIGSGLSLGLMIGAIAMHLTILGISVKDDGGYLFFLAITVALCSAFVLVENRNKVFSVLKISERF